MKSQWACHNNAWCIEIWPKDRPDEVATVPFRCLSWRCEGDCRRWKGAQDFVRIKEAMGKLTSWCHFVLTYDPGRWKDKEQLFRAAVVHWSKLRKRLTRHFDDIKYIQTWEVHKSGYPHVHIAISNVKIYSECEKDAIRNFHRLMMADAVACGFGRIGWLEPIRDAAAMAGYLGKLARELTGEKENSQVPVDAPRNFRRLRASRRLLPPPNKNPDVTGCLLFCRDDGEIVGQGMSDYDP